MIRWAFILLGILGIGDTILVSAYSNINFGTLMPMILGMPLLLIGLFYGKITAFFASSSLGMWLRWLLITAYAVFFVLFLFCAALMYREGHAVPPADADAVIVLGCGIRGDRVSLTLAKRLDSAIAYAQENPSALIVVSGGMGAGEYISEAEAMRRYLTEKGVAEERILMEDRSASTYENFIFSKKLLDERLSEDASLIFVTTRFHVFRSERIARSLGIHAEGIGADGVGWLTPNDYLRETAAIVYYFLAGRI
ncbi:MAG: YdcF family protein [Clostridiales bacterium]|nr:YdcF family protein [Clostridiales bacterium]